MGEKIYGLVGRSLGHSFSVLIHKAFGLDSYRLFQLEPEALGDFFANPDIAGVNVTIPYKREVMRFCDEISPEAEAIGSVNTIVRKDGRLVGHNTDVAGLEYMAKSAGIDFSHSKTVIFGSGGASLTAIYVAKKLGARQVVVISRKGEDNYSNLSRHFDADILINATPLGTYPIIGCYPADPGLFPGCRGVLDLNYNPRRTAFLQLAEKAGLPGCGGLGMLAEQARAAEELFLDKKIPTEETPRVIAEIRKQTQNIVLIGMPGSGKSTVGECLSRLTGRRAVDIDREIEIAEGRSIPEIFSRSGEEYFRELESQLTASFAMESGRIIVTGGGVVKYPENYDNLHCNGRIYFLRREVEELATEGRPLSQGGNLQELYQQRLPLYMAFADAETDNEADPETAAGDIWRDFCENIGN